MPQPLKNEKKSEYISRCIVEVMREGASREQAAGKCYGMWDDKKSKAKWIIDDETDNESIVE